ncbi:MAG: SipW-dependent-type signal peptide-containing protein [Christensenellaceae bacterium]
MKKKTLALFLVLALAFGGVIGGTVAWLTDTSDTVVNTFTDSDIEITLTETGAVENANSYKMVPGYTISKDPEVTVEAGSEKCYLFVKLDKSDNFDSFLTYEIADGWTALDGVENVYYRVVDTTTEAVTFSVLKDDQVTVKSDVTKEKMNELKNGSSLQPTLTVTAYASQFNKSADESFTVQEAWNNIPPSSTN